MESQACESCVWRRQKATYFVIEKATVELLSFWVSPNFSNFSCLDLTVSFQVVSVSLLVLTISWIAVLAIPSTCCGNRLPGVGGWCIYVARDSRDDRCGDIGVESIRNSGGLQRTDGMLQDYLHSVSFRYLEYLDLLKTNRAVGSCAMVLAEVCTFLKGRAESRRTWIDLLFSIICIYLYVLYQGRAS